MKAFTIIIPTLNEAENVRPLLSRLSDIAQVFNLHPEILFVDDGSTDGTCSEILTYDGKLKVSLLERRDEKGLAGAVILGAKMARHDSLVVMDCDLSHPPESIPQLIAPVLAGDYDMVIGSRYHKDGRITGWPLQRKAASRIATLPAQLLTGIQDPLSGFFSIKREYLTGISSNQHGFKIGLEVLRLFGNRIRTMEVPIHFTDRSSGESKMNRGVILNYLFQLGSCFGIEPPAKDFTLFFAIGIFAGLFDMGIFLWLSEAGIETTSCHMASFIMTGHLLYCFGLEKVFSDSCSTIVKPFWSTYRHLMIILVPALFLRGGLLGSAMGNSLSLQATASVMAVTTTLTWIVYGSTLRSSVTHKSLPKGHLALTLISYTLILRLLYLGSTELIQEEAYYWNYAQHLAPGYLDHPPLVAFLIWLGTAVFGNTELGIRAGSYLCWFVTAYFSYRLTLSMYSSKTATYALLLIAVLPIFFGSALVMTPDAPLIACWSATLFFLYRAFIENSTASWFYAGISFGLGLSSKYTIVLLAPAALLFMLSTPAGRRWFRTPMPWVAVTLAALFFSPVIWWNMENGWASFLFQSHGRVNDASMFTTHRLLASILLLITPAGLFTAVLSILPWNTISLKKTFTDNSRASMYLFTLFMTVVPLLVFFIFSLTREVKLNWTGPVWLATVPFMAQFLSNSLHNSKSDVMPSILAAGWSKTPISLILVYGLSLHYLGIGLPGIPYPKNTILLGWDDLARKVEKVIQKQESADGRRPVVVGMDKYRIASGVSFYQSKKESDLSTGMPAITGRHLFDMESLMFRYWHPSTLFSHHDLLVISQNRGWLHPDYFRHKALNVGEIKELSVQKNGRDVSQYYYRILKGYIPSSGEEMTVRR